MTTWILPIKPKWAKLIYSGEKTVEVRLRVPETIMYPHGCDTVPDWFRVLLYETLPVQQITGFVLMRYLGTSDCYLVTDEELAAACLSRDEFDDYTRLGDEWREVEFVSLLKLTAARRFDTPQTVADHGLKRAPQSWVRSRREKA